MLDLSWLRCELAPHYSHTGCPSVDPELLIRMLIVGYCYSIRCERRLCQKSKRTPAGTGGSWAPRSIGPTRSGRGVRCVSTRSRWKARTRRPIPSARPRRCRRAILARDMAIIAGPAQRTSRWKKTKHHATANQTASTSIGSYKRTSKSPSIPSSSTPSAKRRHWLCAVISQSIYDAYR